MADAILKTCYRCKQCLPLSDFNKSSRFNDGLRKECKPCGRTDSLAYRNANLERQRESKRLWAERNAEKVLAYSRAYHAANREAVLPKARARAAQYRQRDPENYALLRRAYVEKARDRILERKRASNARNPEPNRKRALAWAKANPGRMNARIAARRAAEIRATPIWANAFFIEQAYDIAQRRSALTGIKWHVDHQVPLVSKKVCGLHVEHNLKVIPAVENLRKNNRFWPDMP